MKQAILKKPLALVLALLMVFSISATSIYYASAIDVNTVLTVERGGKVKDEYILDKFEKTAEIHSSEAQDANRVFTFNPNGEERGEGWTPSINNLNSNANFIAGFTTPTTFTMVINVDTLNIEAGAPTLHVFNNQTLVVKLSDTVNESTINYSSENPAFMVHSGGNLVFDIPEGKTLNVVGNGNTGSFVRFPSTDQLAGNPVTGGIVGTNYTYNGKMMSKGNVKFSNFNTYNGVISSGSNSSRLYMYGATFNNNSDTNGGGAVHFTSVTTGTVVLDNCTFNGNAATNNSGGAFRAIMGTSNSNSSGNIVINGCTFTGNTALGSGRTGGAIYILPSSPNANHAFVLTNSTFDGNQSEKDSYTTANIDVPRDADRTLKYNTVTYDGQTKFWPNSIGENQGFWPADPNAVPEGAEADVYHPIANGIRINAGTTLNEPSTYITYNGNQPATTPTYAWVNGAPAIPSTVDQETELTGTIRVTYSDRSTEDVTLQIVVVPNNDTTAVPTGRTEVTVYNIGDTVEAASEFITNKSELPAGTTYQWCDANGNVIAGPSTATSSPTTDYRIKVTYPNAGSIPYYVTVAVRVLGAQDSGNLNDPFDPESIVGDNTHIHMDADYEAVFNPTTEKFELYLHLNLSTEVAKLETYNNLYFLRTSFKYNNEKYTPVVDGNLSTEMIQIKAPQSGDLLAGDSTAQGGWYTNHYTYTASDINNNAEIYTYASPFVQGFTKENIQEGQYQLGTITFRVNDANVVQQLAPDIAAGYTAAKDQLSGASGTTTFADGTANRAEAAMNLLGSGWLKSGVFNEQDNTDETVQDVDIAFLKGGLYSNSQSSEYDYALLTIDGLNNDIGTNENVYWNVLGFQAKSDEGRIIGARQHGFGMVMAQDDPKGGSNYESPTQTNEFTMLERYSNATGNFAKALEFWNKVELNNQYGDLINKNLPTENMLYRWMQLTPEVRDIINSFDNLLGYRTFYVTKVSATFHSNMIAGGGNILYDDSKTSVFTVGGEQLRALAQTNELENLNAAGWLNVVEQVPTTTGASKLPITQAGRGQNATTATNGSVFADSYIVIKRDGALPYVQKVTDDVVSEAKVVEIAKAKLKVAAQTGTPSPDIIRLLTALGSANNALMLSPGDVARSNADFTDIADQDGYIDTTDVSSIIALQGRTSAPSAVGTGLELADTAFDLDDSGTITTGDVSIAQTNSNDGTFNNASIMFNSTNSLDGRITVEEFTTN